MERITTNNEKFIMITGQGCQHCKNAKKKFASQIASGKIKVMDFVTDDKALALVDKYNIRGVPTIIRTNGTDETGEVCNILRNGNIKCGNEEITL